MGKVFYYDRDENLYGYVFLINQKFTNQQAQRNSEREKLSIKYKYSIRKNKLCNTTELLKKMKIFDCDFRES